MGTLIPDPELERIIQEMNLEAVGEPDDDRAGSGLDDQNLRDVRGGEPLDALLNEMVRRQASDLLLVPGSTPVLRVGGTLQMLQLPVVEVGTVRELFDVHLGRRSRQQLADRGSTDFSLRMPESADHAAWRFRVNVQRQAGGLAAAVRALPRRIPSLPELGLPTVVGELATAGNGLILVCGPTGSGKSTTLAAMLDRVNEEELRHVITIEDPIEYEHSNRRSVFEQVEIGSDAPGFAEALRAALRRDPDVILVGEMRDLETISTALTAAETGHLVLSTLHTADSAQALHRIIDVFPAARQEQIRHQLALSVRAVICQQLLTTADGERRVPAVEVLIATYAVRNHIRRGTTERLYNEIVGGRGRGMQTMEQSLTALVRSGAITAEEASSRTSRPEELARSLSSTS